MALPASTQAGTRLVVGPLRIDLARAIVTDEHGGPSGLTPRAEELLLLLCRNAGNLVSREEILETVWSGTVVEDAAITNCIWQIRKAFGEQGKHLLQTRPRRGYLLSLPPDAWRGDDDVESTAEPAPTAASADAPVPRPAPVQAPRWFWLFAALLLIFNISVYLWLWPSTQRGGTSDVIRLAPYYEIHLSVIAPDRLDALRVDVLRTTAMEAWRRQARVWTMSGASRREAYAGTTLHVEVEDMREDRVAATIRLADARNSRSMVFRGPLSGLVPAVADFMRQELPPPGREPTPGAEAYVEGVVAEQRLQIDAALEAYRRALALYPAMPEAKIAIARIDFSQGRWSEAAARVRELAEDATLPQHQRCELNLLLLDVTPDARRAAAVDDKLEACGN